MVKVREDQPLTEAGLVDIGQWIERLQEDVKLRDATELREACELAQRLEQDTDKSQSTWRGNRSSFRMGLEMADILGELRLDQTTL